MEQINRRDLGEKCIKIQRFSIALAAFLLVFLYAFGETAAEVVCDKPEFHPSLQEGIDAMESTDTVLVKTIDVAMWPGSKPAPAADNSYFAFEPKNQVPTIGLIIHPGGNCDPRAYAPMAQAIASEGYLVAILPMPNCVSMGGYDRTAQVIEDFGEIEKWVLAGHSVGGASISWYTYEYGDIEGLVILAGLGHNRYPLDDTHNVRVLSLYGEKDTHLTPEMIMEHADSLPADTVYEELKGANHTQFGWLDPTPYPEYFDGDGPADITYQEQQDLVVGYIIDFLQSFETNLSGPSYRCDLDTSKTRYELAADLDECLALNAQIMTAHIENEDIEIRAEGFTDFRVFESNFADINAEENWVKPIYIFFEEDMSSYPSAPDTINGAFVLKMKSKEKIDADFGLTNSEPQGLCVDVQQVVYDNVLNNLLTMEQRARYLSEGKSLTFIPDDDEPPFNPVTNPVSNGGQWVSDDPASRITHEGDDYSFEPYSLFIEYSDPEFENIGEKLRGVRYCKLLSHQAILSWMLEKSFEDDPVLLTPAAGCDEPSSLEARGGSCIIYFGPAESYYCSDYTGSEFDFETGRAKCDDRWDTSVGVLDPSYSELPCSKRTAEIKASIPGYMGLTGACIIHCNEGNEFIWNVYTENPASSCTGFDFFIPEDDNAQCPVVSLLGEQAPQAISLRRFRDEVLAKSTAGKRLIGYYYLHAATITHIFDNHPTVRGSVKWVLKSLVPILDKLL
jgi:hypothetical protein